MLAIKVKNNSERTPYQFGRVVIAPKKTVLINKEIFNKYKDNAIFKYLFDEQILSLVKEVKPKVEVKPKKEVGK